MIPSDSTKKREVYTELNFEVPLGDQVLVGTMDRLVIQRNFQTNEIEKISLIDFKVSRKSQSARSLLASYQTQMALYAWAITRLEPLVSLDQVEGVLVSISAQSVSQVAVEWGRAGRESIGERLGRQAMAIVRGEEGVARPGSQCKVCEFRTICDSSVLKKPEQLHFLFGQS